MASTDHASSASPPVGVHLVGSVPLADAQSVFGTMSAQLPGRLYSIPDGETGERGTFLDWQKTVFADWPAITWVPFVPEPKPPSPTKEELDAIVAEIRSMKPGLQTQYDTHAIASYREFARLQAEGKIEPAVKFQVCLPTPFTALMRFNADYVPAIEELYTVALFQALDNIQRAIPHDRLVVQWDAPREMAYMEGIEAWGAPREPWFHPVMEGVLERLERAVNAVAEDVDVGLHLCYGDASHKHFIQPKDAAYLVELANRVAGMMKGRALAYLHLPVPIDRTDEAYFAPLTGLKTSQRTKLYLGLLHADDLEGTRKRIAVARKVLPDRDFGVASGKCQAYR